MVDCHGSQCGFCTPGFVMSLFAMTRDHAEVPDEASIDEVLAGNLCRCTGYAPIVRAARQAYDHDPRDDAFARRSEEHTSELQSLMRISNAVFCFKKIQHTKAQHPTILNRF